MSYDKLPQYALLGLSLFSLGCATKKHVNTLDKRVLGIEGDTVPRVRNVQADVSDLKRQISDLEAQVQSSGSYVPELRKRIQDLESTPLVEKTVMLTYGHGYDSGLRKFMESLIERYSDPKSKEEAKKYGNAVIVVPTVGGNSYNVFLVFDKDGNQQPSWETDRVLPDGIEAGFRVANRELPELLRAAIMSVKSVKRH